MADQPPSILTPEVRERIQRDLESVEYVPDLVGSLIVFAIDSNASDLLFDPGVESTAVRVRIDGILHFVLAIPAQYYSAVVSRIKIMSELDITQHWNAQEGKIDFEHNGRLINLRVAIAKVITGEVVALRLHDTRSIIYSLDALGMQDPALSTYIQLLKSRSGLLLICGPTGSGKTSTLYSTLNYLNDGTTNIISIEDPIEYLLPGINQMQTDRQRGLTFAEGLKVILRLNPDRIFVGEIRDPETAHIAVESAMTGHLVFSTIHASSAAAVIPRLADLNIESFFINSSVIGAVSQRLVRRVCTHCAQEVPLGPEEAAAYYKATGEQLATQLQGQGCAECTMTGYKGRIGIYEVMAVDETVRTLVKEGVSIGKIERALQESGFRTILQDGMAKVTQRVTTVQEVLTNAYVTV
jgi:type II secretory ATPase GspE/PulE/Tfp pilus assembly ATPase PilB-like protein